MNSSISYYEKNILALDSGEMTACDLFVELLSNSSISFGENGDFFFFMYNLFLDRDPTIEEESAGYNTLLMPVGRRIILYELVKSEEFVKRCQDSYITAGDDLSGLK